MKELGHRNSRQHNSLAHLLSHGATQINAWGTSLTFGSEIEGVRETSPLLGTDRGSRTADQFQSSTKPYLWDVVEAGYVVVMLLD